MKRYFAYIRVSTAKQGEHGSSLQEQRSAIENYARKQNVSIFRWYEEIETAAKMGRRVFAKMMADQKREHISGIIVHKIDRSARNLKDWATIGELIDEGVEVHFAHESLDMRSRGGRLAADVQAVVAADYIRNLRDEVKKGFYGRLKQGFYPLPAPIGYLDRGGGKVKEIDPVCGPIVFKAFELYGAGTHSLVSLQDELHRQGLRKRSGRPVSRTGIAHILHNPFYCGLIRIRSTGETFDGAHLPLISISLFDQVQRRLASKANQPVRTHNFLLRRLLRCAKCGATLTGELQKARVYYRCHTRSCAGTSIREDSYVTSLRLVLSSVQLDDRDFRDFVACLDLNISKWRTAREARSSQTALALAAGADRLIRLTDAFLDGAIDRELFQSRKQALLEDKVRLKNEIASLENKSAPADRLRTDFELARTAQRSFDTGNEVDARDLIKRVTSNLVLDGKKPVIALQSPFREIAEGIKKTLGAPCRGTFRTDVREIVARLEKLIEQEDRSAA